MYSRKILYLLLFIIFLPAAVDAQSRNQVKLTLLDSLSRQPIEFATVYLSKDSTTRNALFALTDEKGAAVIQNVPAGVYRFKAEMMGYKPVQRQVSVGNRVTDLGEIKMKTDVETLEGATISAVGNPIVVKKDTIEYNASSFKTTDADMLEELLKKLPGIEIDADGKITANGKQINKIMVDGRAFFLDDPQLATKNIPAKIIEKVKVVERKSEQSQFTGIDDGHEETIIDLSILPGMMKGWFGSVSGGGGLDMVGRNNDARFQGSAMVGKFSSKTQISVIGNGNNTNNRGFNDMAGDMMKAMRPSRGGSHGSSGWTSPGITTSWMGGANVNSYLLKDDAMKIGGNYLYSGSNKFTESSSNKKTFIDGDETLENINKDVDYTETQGHRVGLEIDYKITEKTSILFRPQFNYGYGSFIDSTLFSSTNSVSGKVNDGYSTSYGNNDSWTTSGRLLLRQKIGEKKGRSLSVNFDYSLSNNDVQGQNKSLTNHYRNNELVDSAVVDQKYTRKQDRYSLSGRLSYIEPLGRNYYVEAAYRYRFNQNNANKLTYDYDGVKGDYDVLNTRYSNLYKNSFINQNAEVNFNKQEEKFSAQAGFSLQPSTTRSVEYLYKEKRDSVLQYSVLNFSPSARFNYKFSPSKYIRVDYRGNTTQPTVTQLQPVPDNTNPQRISLGNPTLQPEFTHDVGVSFRNMNKKIFSSFYTSLNFSYTKDNIVTASWYNDAGVQFTAPVNSTAGTYDGSGRITYNTPIAKSRFSFMTFTDFGVRSYLTYTGTGEARNIEEIKDDLMEGRTTSLRVMERLNFVYRDDYVEARVGGRASYNHAWYTIQNKQKSATWTNSVNASVIATLPFGLGIRTDANYTFYIGYDEGYGDPRLIWNAELYQLLFKKKATLRLKVYDILNQSSSISHVTQDNFVRDRQSNSLGRYAMLSFTYRFGNFNDARKGMKSSKSSSGGSYHRPSGPYKGRPAMMPVL